RVGPTRSPRSRDTLRPLEWCFGARRIADPFMREFRVGFPVGSDGGQAAGHGFHEGHVPTLASAGGDVAVGRTIEEPELVVRELPVEDEGDLASRLSQSQPRIPSPLRLRNLPPKVSAQAPE